MLEYLETNKQPTTAAANQHQQPAQHTSQQPLAPFVGGHNQLLPIANNGGPFNNSYQQQQQQQQQQQALLAAQSSGQQMLMKTDSQVQSQFKLHSPTSAPNNNELIGYYFGSISRETSEWILKTHGNQMDGTYLLRSSGPNDNFVLSLLVVHPLVGQQHQSPLINTEVLHYKIVETEDSFVALHGQVGDEKFATIDELIDKAQGVATKPRWPIQRQSLESQILPPTYWGLTVDQVRLAILIKAKQWGFPMFSSLFQHHSNGDQSPSSVGPVLPNGNGCQTNESCANASGVTTLNNETIRTLIYKSLHEFQPWFHGKISRDEAERRIDEDGGRQRDGRFLVRERDNYSYAMCISHKKTTKHYRIDVLSTGELAIQDGRKFTSLMALVSHYTIMSDGLWCALTEACPRPIQAGSNHLLQSVAPANPQNTSNAAFQQAASTFAPGSQIDYPSIPTKSHITHQTSSNNLYCRPMYGGNNVSSDFAPNTHNMMLPPVSMRNNPENGSMPGGPTSASNGYSESGANKRNTSTTIGRSQPLSSMSSSQVVTNLQIKAPIKEWLQTINHKWSQFISSKNQHQSLNSFLFGSSNPLNNHCRHHGARGHPLKHHHHGHHHHHHNGHNHNHHHHHNHNRRRCKNDNASLHQATCSSCNLPQQQPQTPNELGAVGRKMDPGNPVTKLNNTGHRTRSQLSSSAGAATRGSGGCSCCAMTTPSNPTVPQPTNGQTGLALVSQPLPVGDINHTIGSQSLALQHSTNTNSLPMGSGTLLGSNGFVSNGQSFVGSPLFAVKPSMNSNIREAPLGVNLKGPGSSGSTNSNSSSSGKNNNNGNTLNEEKLISPAHSISANLNNCNPYNLGSEIYRSAASTVLVKDDCHLQTNSSSSSSGGQFKPNANSAYNNHQQIHSYRDLVNQFNASGAFVAPQTAGCNANNTLGSQRQPIVSEVKPLTRPTHQQTKQQTTLPISHAGPIFCGQHAGPAYRYTNCTGNENIGPCNHQSSRQLVSNGAPGPLATPRAADDSLLMDSTTQLVGPAALTKFVQFQDGQCLRTHRDTRSIQMAYLLSRQSNHNNLQQVQQSNPTHPGSNLVNVDGSKHLACKAKMGGQTSNGFQSNPTTSVNFFTRHADLMEVTGKQKDYPFCRTQQHQQQRACDQEIDLIDCDGDGFDFKYDPKLIKSSSIETLCGIGDDDREQQLEFEEDLTNFKTNSELVMSLKPCWFNNLAENSCSNQSDILCPIPAYDSQTSDHQGPTNSSGSQNKLPESCDQLETQSQRDSNDRNSILSSLMTEAANIDVTEVHYDSLKKKHDLDELTTNLLAELTTSLKAQIDLKNKQSGIGATASLNSSSKQQTPEDHQQQFNQHDIIRQKVHTSERSPKLVRDPRELANEFDTLIHSNNR